MSGNGILIASRSDRHHIICLIQRLRLIRCNNTDLKSCRLFFPDQRIDLCNNSLLLSLNQYQIRLGA